MNHKIEVLLLDIGGVLLSNGWDSKLRAKAAKHFGLDIEEVNSRHALMFNSFEIGALTFDAYLHATIFFEKRDFTLDEFKRYVFNAVCPYSDMIETLKLIKKHHKLRVGAISNEGRELAQDRIERFSLQNLCDFFVVSAFVGYTKPNPEIYRLAIDLSGAKPSKILYIDDRLLLAEMGKSLGLNAIHHVGLLQTKQALDSYGLILPHSSAV